MTSYNVLAYNQFRLGSSYHAVLTDLGMPGIDGRRVAEAIKARSADTPIIMITGWGQGLGDQDAEYQHVDRVIAKPVRMQELRLILQTYCHKNGTRDHSAS